METVRAQTADTWSVRWQRVQLHVADKWCLRACMVRFRHGRLRPPASRRATGLRVAANSEQTGSRCPCEFVCPIRESGLSIDCTNLLRGHAIIGVECPREQHKGGGARSRAVSWPSPAGTTTVQAQLPTEQEEPFVRKARQASRAVPWQSVSKRAAILARATTKTPRSHRRTTRRTVGQTLSESVRRRLIRRSQGRPLLPPSAPYTHTHTGIPSLPRTSA